MKLKKIGWYKKKLWPIFSLYIRISHSDHNGMTKCITCEKMGHWEEFHAGHFLAGRNNGVLFEPRGCFPQCPRCNIFLHGNVENFYPFMLNKYGKKVIAELKYNKMNPPKLDISWYEDKIKEYQRKLDYQKKRIGLI